MKYLFVVERNCNCKDDQNCNCKVLHGLYPWNLTLSYKCTAYLFTFSISCAISKATYVFVSKGDNINVELVSQMMAHKDDDGAFNIHPDPPWVPIVRTL